MTALRRRGAASGYAADCRLCISEETMRRLRLVARGRGNWIYWFGSMAEAACFDARSVRQASRTSLARAAADGPRVAELIDHTSGCRPRPRRFAIPPAYTVGQWRDAMPAPLRSSGAERVTISERFLNLDRLPSRVVLVGGATATS